MLNKIILQGRLTRDPEMFATRNGDPVCKFTLANNRKFKDKDEVLFIDCTAFGKTADACGRYLAKGALCLVSGKLISEKWTGKDGQEKQKNSVNVEEVEFLSRPDNQHSPQPQYQQPPAYQTRQPATQPVQSAITDAIKQQEAQQQEPPEDDIPF